MSQDNQRRDPALLSEFPVPETGQWRAEVERLLKGAPFAKRMFTRTVEGITVGPMYTAEDTRDLPWAEHFPGQTPFVRGHWPAGTSAPRWLVAQDLPCPAAEEFNRALRHDLQRGQSAVCLVLDQAGLRGLDPDQAEVGLVGREGTSLASLEDLAAALHDVDLGEVPLCLQPGASALPVAAMLAALLRRQGVDPSRLKGSLGCDPVFGLAEMGTLPVAMDQLQDELAVLTRWAVDSAPGVTTLPVYELPWHQGGADAVLGLGLTLASAVNVLRSMEARDIALELAAPRIRFRMVVGTDFFMEIAKLRALRLLWSDILVAAGCSTECCRAPIHAQTSTRCYTAFDPHVNMLRATTMAMSAVMGGVDSLAVAPFDAVDSLPDEFSRRIARNVQLILAEECHLDQVADPAGGSWYVEKLTAEVAAAAWQVFRDIEAEGGIVKALQAGTVQARVAEAARVRRERLATGRDVLVGTTRYPDPDEAPRKARRPDLEAFHRQRAQAMTAQRTAAAHEDHLIVLKRLEKIITARPDELFECLVEAATQGATIGELTGTLRHDADSQLTVAPIVRRRDAEPFEQLRRRAAALQEGDPRSVRVFCACLGDFAAYMPRLDFVKGFFRTGGFEVVADAFFTDVDAAAGAAAAAGASVVVLVGLDTTYADQAVPLARKLLAMTPRPRIILAGQPKDRMEALTEAGVDTFIHARSNLLDVLGDLLDNTEVSS